MAPYEFIENYQIVMDTFGRWPGFHDGEVFRVVLDRTRRLSDGPFYPSIELSVRGWNMTTEVTEDGYYKLEEDSLVHLLFEHVSDVELGGLNHQNVISGLDLELSVDPGSGSPVLSVEINHCYGLSGGFKALRASVLSVEPIAR